MKEKIKSCFDRLQKLDIPPSVNNLEILLQTLYDLREVYNSIRDGEESADS